MSCTKYVKSPHTVHPVHQAHDVHFLKLPHDKPKTPMYLGHYRLPWNGKDGLAIMRRWLKAIHPEGIPRPGTVLYNWISQSRAFQAHYELVADDLLQYGIDGDLLDVGTGPGWLLLKIHERRPDLRLKGVDVSLAMVERAGKNLRQAGLGGSIAVDLCESTHLPYPDAAFGAVVSTGSIHHWKNPVEELDEIYRIMKPGGLAFIYDLVADTPKKAMLNAAQQFGRMKIMLFWVHTFEEPFYSQREMMGLAGQSQFQKAKSGFLGLFFRMIMKKEG